MYPLISVFEAVGQSWVELLWRTFRRFFASETPHLITKLGLLTEGNPCLSGAEQ